MHDQLSIDRPVDLDWSAPIADTPLAQGLAALWSAYPHGGAVLFDLAGPHDARGSGGAIQWRTDAFGGWAPYFDGGYNAVGTGLDLGVGAGGGAGAGFTLLVLHVPAAALAGTVFRFDVGSDNFSLLGGSPGGDVQLNLAVAGHGGGITVDGGVVAGAPQVWAAAQGADGVTGLYVDGVLLGTSAGAAGFPIPAGAGDYNVGTLYTGTVPLAALWRRRLTDAEIWDVSKNPWQLLRRPTPPTSLHFTGLTGYAQTDFGAATIRNAFAGAEFGAARVGYASYAAADLGAYRLLQAFGSSDLGASAVLNSFSSQDRGVYVVSVLTSYAQSDFGLHNVFAARRATELGRFRFVIACADVLEGKYRVANASLDRYELYRGVDGDPDFTASPYETFTSLPHTTAAQDPSHTYSFVLRKRNAWGLLSQNMIPTDIEIDDVGELVPTPPSPPTSTSVTAAAAGAVAISATYDYATDGTNQADAFLIYTSVIPFGSPPPAWPPFSSMTPIVVPMNKSLAAASLRYTTDPYAEGTTVRVVVRTRRSGSPDVDSTNGTTPAYSAVATLLGPDAVLNPAAFLGTSDGQELT